MLELRADRLTVKDGDRILGTFRLADVSTLL
jgi:hypothetical protein